MSTNMATFTSAGLLSNSVFCLLDMASMWFEFK